VLKAPFLSTTRFADKFVMLAIQLKMKIKQRNKRQE
jgi:hypothetical protein